jgi:AcrR family transcriptional regulator
MTTTLPDTTSARPLRKDAARNRELLIAAAREVFAKRGLDASLDEVAKHAGVGVGTAYRHFANKYELLSALLGQAVDELMEKAHLALQIEDPWDSIVAFLEAALSVQSEDRGLREALMGVHDPEKMHHIHDRLVEPITEVLDRAKAAGVVRQDVEATDLGFIITMACSVADVACDVAPQLWRRYLAMCLDGIRPGGDPLPGPPLSDREFRQAMADHKQSIARVRQ